VVVVEALPSLLLSCKNLPPSKRGLGLAYSTGIVIKTHFDYRFRMEEEFARLLFFTVGVGAPWPSLRH